MALLIGAYDVLCEVKLGTMYIRLSLQRVKNTRVSSTVLIPRYQTALNNDKTMHCCF